MQEFLYYFKGKIKMKKKKPFVFLISHGPETIFCFLKTKNEGFHFRFSLMSLAEWYNDEWQGKNNNNNNAIWIHSPIQPRLLIYYLSKIWIEENWRIDGPKIQKKRKDSVFSFSSFSKINFLWYYSLAMRN